MITNALPFISQQKACFERFSGFKLKREDTLWAVIEEQKRGPIWSF
jgi:hypothetical protein